MNARFVAWHLLREHRVLARRTVVRAARDAELDSRQRAELGAILGAEVRRRATLRAIAESLGERRLRPEVALFAHVGLAQLLFVPSIPPHAAISQTVEAARTALGERPSSAVNGLLRRIQREMRRGSSGDARRDVPLADLHFDAPVFADPLAHWLLWAEQALSLPVPIGRRWRNRHGEERAALLARAMILSPDVSLYVARGEPDALRAEQAASGMRASGHPRVLLAPSYSRRALLGSQAVTRGDLVPLGETAARAAELLGPQPGERVLELRAPRRRANPLLALSGARFETIVVDAGDANDASKTSNATPNARARSDARGDFDAAFVSPPCSATGILASKPGARWLFDAARSATLLRQQTEALTRAAAAVRPGGRLVYATRSVEPDENERRIRTFLVAHPEWTLDAERPSLPAEPGSEGPVDGGYAARLARG